MINSKLAARSAKRINLNYAAKFSIDLGLLMKRSQTTKINIYTKLNMI
jgi:hypothetical protein